MLSMNTRRIGLAAFVAMELVAAVGCQSKGPPASSHSSAKPSTSAAAADGYVPRASAATSAAPPIDAATLERNLLKSALERWNVATNTADSRGLTAAYAKQLSLYQRLVTREEAVKRKLDYVTKHPGFSQRVEQPSCSESGERRIVRFRKTSSSQSEVASTVDAYLAFEKSDGAWVIVDEGDVQTTRKLSAGADTRRKDWREREWDCPKCSAPESGERAPSAGPPLGPDRVKATQPVPPGAPGTLEYGRAYFPRFASAVDVPLFLKATPESSNGDGRWFYYDAADAGASADAGGARRLLYCTIGGHFSQGNVPAHAKPDPGHSGEPRVKYTTRFEKRKDELYYERFIYAADGVMNYVYCTFDPSFEKYFHAIVERMGRSMRAIAGGQPSRVERESQPYTAER
jgi:hypothetical protein